MRTSCLVLLVVLLVQQTWSLSFLLPKQNHDARRNMLNAASDNQIKARNRALINEIVRVLEEESHADEVAKRQTDPNAWEGKVRLAHGGILSEGVAQVYSNGQWGNICDRAFINGGWPQVICTELGYPSALSSVYVGSVPDLDPISGYPITLKSPACDLNSADSMANCGQDTDPECDNTQAVYVACEPMVRVGDQGADEGVAQMYKNKQWGTICDNAFNNNGWPQVLCVELGYTKAASSRQATTREKADYRHLPIAFPSPNCNLGNADRMAQCGQDTDYKCNHGKDVYVKCALEEGAVALDKVGSSDKAGIALIYKDGRWGTICDRAFVNSGWPQVFCLDMGYASAKSSVYVGSNYKTTLPISFMSPACNPSTADSMAECDQDTNPECDHSQDVYVTCA